MAVETEPSFVHGEAQAVIDTGAYFDPLAARQWDVARDGRFLMIKPSTETADGEPVVPGPPKINAILNWHQELLERVPVP